MKPWTMKPLSLAQVTEERETNNEPMEHLLASRTRNELRRP